MKKLVQKFLENRCTPDEAENVLRWLQTQEGEEYLKKQMNRDKKHFFKSAESNLYPELDSARLLDEIRQKKDSGTKPSAGRDRFGRNQLLKERKSAGRFRSIFMFAAAAVFLIAAVLVFSPPDFRESGTDTAASYQVFETERGERKTIRLRDGSKVIINHESRISIPDTFSENNRKLFLEGEAWFEVVSDASNPFRIEASNSTIRVLGTSFAVKSHAGQESTRVVVTNGRVSLEAREQGTTREKLIGENQGGIVKTGRGIELQEIADPELYTGWKDGKLIFKNTSFEEVAERLERWYNIDCIIQEPAVKKEHFTSVFEDEPLEQVLDVIALSMNISYEINHQTITFKTNNL
jgi:transmembrane sensor